MTKEFEFQRDLIGGKQPVKVGQILRNKRFGRLVVTAASAPYTVDGDMDDDAGGSGGGFRAGKKWQRQDYVCVKEATNA